MGEIFDGDSIHAPDMSEHEWQESVVLLFHDKAAGVSFYCRIGTQPPKDGCQEWVYAQGPDGTRFRRMRFGLPLTERSRRPDGFGAGGLDFTYQDDGSIRLLADYPDLQLDIVYRDFYPSTPCWNWIGGNTLDIGAAAHFESSGAVTGTMILGGTRYEIAQGLGHRDHSWGSRHGERMRACRWVVGTAGPAMSWSMLTFLDRDGNLVRGGWVMRDGILSHLADMDIVADMNIDGLTARGGRGAVVLDTGERLDFTIRQRAALISGHDSDHGGPNSYACSENVSYYEWSNGLVGAGCFTVCESASGMGDPVVLALDAWSTLTDGLSKRRAAKPLLA